ncbi:MAG TPA: hypothetical protein PKM65_13400 [Spirochaetota bacterium]|nr:hypothetical protein [Spirochaetota bacterium]HNT11062.1 hypothetical protein [Spirochaetota bacterium]HNV48429.1 hypothetical protein [Spirochaetota bacterium]HOS39401.1 hypothetical protein [Spirochaetota bacterium]HPU88545.1 hypothetical protein [Spirochaetota bacterium]
MKCSRCGTEIHKLNHYYIPSGESSQGLRYCIKCAKEEKIVTLI